MAGNAADYRLLLAEVSRVLRQTIRTAVARSGQGNADVEDIVQETLLAVHLKRDTWNPELPFGPWLNAIARYKTIDALRRRGLRRHVDIDVVADALPSDEGDAMATHDLDRLLLAMDDRERTIVRGISVEGRSATSMATELGMTEGAVRVALHRALQKLARFSRRGDA
jgi:RNA polymerase sigma-70 factor (ECF subfamily)